MVSMSFLTPLTTFATRTPPEWLAFLGVLATPKCRKLSHQHAPFYHSLRRMSSAPAEHELGLAVDPYVYTSGRWLRHDKLQRAWRYIKFNSTRSGEELSNYVLVLNPLQSIRK